MKVEELYEYGIPQKLIQIFREKGIVELFPPQEEAIKRGLLELRKNFLVAVPTASGKTFIAELLILKSLLERGGKALYIVPLKALASEKFEELKLYESLGLKIGVATGDYDSSSEWLSGYDIIVTTSEKADSIIRHRASWLHQIRCVVADEIHLINDPERGATLEVTIARLMHLIPELVVLGLSATVGNAREVADWLGAELIYSEWRPVKLKQGVYLKGTVFYEDGSSAEVKGEPPAVALAIDTVKDSAQCLLFTATRRGAESLAERISKKLNPDKSEARELELISKEILSVLDEPTRICRRLAAVVERGAAFHHAGLHADQRRIVEDAFRENLIKVLVATPTLAAGVNLPARRVVVRDYRRYDANLGYYPLAVMEIKQMLGRAGRPKYDTYGEAILIAKSQSERDFLLENYILGKPEPITSKLSAEPSLRVHALSTIALGYARSLEELVEFFSRTFYGYQIERYAIESRLEGILEFLVNHGFVEDGHSLRATPFGRRVSELYIDPASAIVLRETLRRAEKIRTSAFSLLHALTRTSELRNLYLRKDDYERCLSALESREKELIFKPPDEFSDPWGFESYLSEIKTALFLQDWIEERGEEFILERYGLAPGDLRSRVEIAEWLLYALEEIARLSGCEGELNKIRNLRLRVKHGVREELLPFVEISGVGRVRARKLFARFRSIERLKKADTKEIAAIPGIGERLAESIKSQLSGGGEIKPKRLKQSRLFK